MEPKFSNEDVKSILCHFLWTTKRSVLKRMFRTLGERTILRLVGRGYMDPTVKLTFKFATGDIMPLVEMAVHRDVPEDMRDEIEKDYQRLVQPYFAELPYGLISVQTPAGEGGNVVIQQQD